MKMVENKWILADIYDGIVCDEQHKYTYIEIKQINYCPLFIWIQNAKMDVKMEIN